MSPKTKAAVKLTIDGKTFSAREGETVLEVARREGIDIPALCHEEGMAAWGACRLCMVEVCLLYTSPSPRDRQKSRMPSSA